MAKAPQAGALISLRLRPHGAVLRHRELCPAARRGFQTVRLADRAIAVSAAARSTGTSDRENAAARVGRSGAQFSSSTVRREWLTPKFRPTLKLDRPWRVSQNERCGHAWYRHPACAALSSDERLSLHQRRRPPLEAGAALQQLRSVRPALDEPHFSQALPKCCPRCVALVAVFDHFFPVR
jgi:hypothetical protein